MSRRALNAQYGLLPTTYLAIIVELDCKGCHANLKLQSLLQGQQVEAFIRNVHTSTHGNGIMPIYM